MPVLYDDSVYKEVEELKREAIEKTGIEDFGDPFFEKPLAAWVNDLNSSLLSDLGRQILRQVVFRDLCRRLKVLACLAEHPEILEVKIPPIILVMGNPRTGTTILHHLIATHPLSRSLLRWELTSPVPPPETETYTTDPRIAKVQAAIKPLHKSHLAKMHWVNSDEPDENPYGFIDCTGLTGRGCALFMPTWFQFLWENDHALIFRDFRKVIQLLIWRCPPPSGGHLVLKCAVTTEKIQAFADVFPESTFMLIHRDPFRSLISTCAGSHSISREFISEPPGQIYENGTIYQDIQKWQKIKIRALIDFASAEPERVANVSYSDLMNDAALTVRTAYVKLGFQVPEDIDQRIINYLNQQRSGKRVAPPKKYDAFGYDADAVWADPTVTEYCTVFGVERERTRLVDTKTGV